MPEIIEENRDVWRLLTYSPGVWLHDYGGPYALNYPQLETIARRLDVTIDDEMLELARLYESESIKGMERKREEEEAKKPKK
jgi:hypothetical protein